MSDETVSQLNHLVEVCRNGQQGFQQAAERSGDGHLTLIFSDLAHQREQFAAQLRYQVSRLGGRPYDNGTVAGAFHRRWIDVRAAVSSDADRALIRECERGERFALASYKLALEHHLHPDALELVNEQRAQIELAYRQLQELHRRVSDHTRVVKRMDAPL
jgi:uncharacterized protein (TIGR02284 family)